MKKKFYAALLAVAVIAFTGYNVYQSSTLSDLALANVEALANMSEERETVDENGLVSITKACAVAG